MPDIASIIATGAANPWLYLPLAVLLGALHALEPGHSKSMMAAFIVAVRGTSAQAALLGISAAFGHTIVVWALAALGLWLGDRLILDRAEPWLVLITGLMIFALSWRVFRLARLEEADHHRHDHADEHGHHHDHDGHHAHTHAHVHQHAGQKPTLTHAEMHERDIQQRFAGKAVTNADIAWFGLTGGLLPCPSALAVLLICIQMKAFVLGFAMVAGFSVGLAVTLVSVGVVAAWGARKARDSAFALSGWAERLPYVSAVIVALIGVTITLKGLRMLGWI